MYLIRAWLSSRSKDLIEGGLMSHDSCIGGSDLLKRLCKVDDLRLNFRSDENWISELCACDLAISTKGFVDIGTNVTVNKDCS